MNNKLPASVAGICLLLCALSSSASDYRFNYTLSSSKPVDWQSYDALYGDWSDRGDIYGCSNWSPSASIIGKGITFVQQATDCKIDQVRDVTPRQIDPITGTVRALKEQTYAETRTSPEHFSQSRENVGILENWYAIGPSYTPWITISDPYDCGAWTPDPNTFTSSSAFSQHGICSVNQTRAKQALEKEEFTGVERASAEPIAESRSVNDQPTERAYRVEIGEWTTQGEQHGCTAWAPDALTVDTGTQFTQTQTGCQEDQTRYRRELYSTPQGEVVLASDVNESRTIVVPDQTRTATGAKPPTTCIFNDVFSSGHRSYVVAVQMTDSTKRNTLHWYYDGSDLGSTNDTYENTVGGVRYVPGKVIRVSTSQAWQVQTYYEACKEG